MRDPEPKLLGTDARGFPFKFLHATKSNKKREHHQPLQVHQNVLRVRLVSKHAYKYVMYEFAKASAAMCVIKLVVR
jgi:hypothetical protein